LLCWYQQVGIPARKETFGPLSNRVTFYRNTLFFDTTTKRTVSGDLISVRRSNGGYLYADRAEITSCDMISENGVVHGVDRVLLPDELEPEEVVIS